MSRIVRERHEKDYTCIANDALRDSRLGWAARGILGYLLSRPDDWTVILGEVIAASPDGRVRVERALDELTVCGYLDRVITRGRDGRRVVSSTVWERAQRGFPAVVIPLRETDRYEVPKDQSSMSETDSGHGDVWDFLADESDEVAVEAEQLPLIAERDPDVVRWLHDRDRRLDTSVATDLPALRAASPARGTGAQVRDVGGSHGTDGGDRADGTTGDTTATGAGAR